jgi:hypothetical protein
MSDGTERDLLLQALDAAYDRPAWHGPNLRGSLTRVDVHQAMWRPAEGQRNMWEITLHAAYWKYIVWRKIAGEKRGSFPRAGSDWFPRPDTQIQEKEAARSWQEDIALLDDMHRRLREAVSALAPDRLPVITYGKVSLADLISGAALHDVYHAGQIQTLKQLYRQASP